MKNDDVINV